MNEQNLFELHFDQLIQSQLSDTARWAKFLSVVGFVLCALLVIGGIAVSTVIPEAFVASEIGLAGPVAIAAIYVIGAVLYFFPCLFMYRFAVKMQKAMRTADQQQLHQSFGNLKACYKFVGILTIIVIAFYALIFIFFIIAAMAA